MLTQLPRSALSLPSGVSPSERAVFDNLKHPGMRPMGMLFTTQALGLAKVAQPGAALDELNQLTRNSEEAVRRCTCNAERLFITDKPHTVRGTQSGNYRLVQP